MTLFDLTGRTVFVEQPSGAPVGRQLLMTLFESEHESYAWLNNTVCVAEGKIDAERLVTHMEVWLCVADLTLQQLRKPTWLALARPDLADHVSFGRWR